MPIEFAEPCAAAPAAVPAAIVTSSTRVDWLVEYLRLTENEPWLTVHLRARGWGFTNGELNAAHQRAVRDY